MAACQFMCIGRDKQVEEAGSKAERDVASREQFYAQMTLSTDQTEYLRTVRIAYTS